MIGEKIYCSVCKNQNDKTKRLKTVEQFDCKWCNQIYCISHVCTIVHECTKYNKNKEKNELTKYLYQVTTPKIIKL